MPFELYIVSSDSRGPWKGPNALLLHSAQQGDIAGIERAVQRDSHALFSEDMMGMSVLHFAATCPGPKGTQTVRRALGQGIQWNAAKPGRVSPGTGRGHARQQGIGKDLEGMGDQLWFVSACSLCVAFSQTESVLPPPFLPLVEKKNTKEYERYYKPMDTQEDLSKLSWLKSVGLVTSQHNEAYLKSRILFTNPDGAPDDEVAMVTIPDGCGVMMEWERPISASFAFSELRWRLQRAPQSKKLRVSSWMGCQPRACVCSTLALASEW